LLQSKLKYAFKVLPVEEHPFRLDGSQTLADFGKEGCPHRLCEEKKAEVVLTLDLHHFILILELRND
jgi:hypothetical protein